MTQADQELTHLLKTQISLSEWFEKIGHADAVALREEDNFKRDRMIVLDDIIGFPFDLATTFPASEVAERNTAFQGFLNTHGHELCALRLIPLDPTLPKLRMRGFTIRDVVNGWFKEQAIDPAKYRADFVPHPSDHLWSTIFVINEQGIFGEIIEGSHQQLTQGFYTDAHPISFAYNFTTWELSEPNNAAEKHLKEIIAHLHVSDPGKQQLLKEKLQATFAHDYLCGYFESVTSADFGIWFIDYNRILGQNFTIQILSNNEGLLKGQIGSPGIARGRVRIISEDMIGNVTLNPDEVLVCDMTTPAYVPLMQRAAAIITDRGGILCHAAIVARELGKPCIVGTKNATQVLKDGDMVEVDAEKGIVRKIEN